MTVPAPLTLALIEQVANAADEIDTQCKLSDELVAQLQVAGLLRALIPLDLVGLELPLPEFITKPYVGWRRGVVRTTALWAAICWAHRSSQGRSIDLKFRRGALYARSGRTHSTCSRDPATFSKRAQRLGNLRR